jgi:predicted nucleic acid-binding Zn ribbon protein
MAEETSEDYDPELPDPEDVGDEDDPTVPCPYCGKRIHEETQICHHCGTFICEDDAPGKSSWMTIGLVVVLCILLAGVISFTAMWFAR